MTSIVWTRKRTAGVNWSALEHAHSRSVAEHPMVEAAVTTQDKEQDGRSAMLWAATKAARAAMVNVYFILTRTIVKGRD
jgi:hypothetical protein